jgi:pimeloyl-ACP methyl ester carboxylesterase
MEAEHRRNHEALARTSRNGTLVIAERSGHHVQLEQPDLVVASIQQVSTGASRK